MSDRIAAIILAAGKGKRMKSDLPKVLHEIGGRPMIVRLLETLQPFGFERTIVVVGYKGEKVQEALADYHVTFAWQREQLGTGHAVRMAAAALSDFDGTTLVALGDVPFLSAASIKMLIDTHQRTEAAATCLSALFDDPSGYGRIVRADKQGRPPAGEQPPAEGRLAAIVEDREASDEIRSIHEINSGTFCFDNRLLFQAVEQLGNDNEQGEYYLTDVVKILNDKKLRVSVVAVADPDEVMGVNSPEQLEMLAEKFLKRPGE